MLHDIFDAVGIPYKETVFQNPPTGAYIAYGTEIDAYGSDFGNEIRRVSVTAELVEPADFPNEEAHILLQNALDELDIGWKKGNRIYYTDVRLFITTYTFDYQYRRD